MKIAIILLTLLISTNSYAVGVCDDDATLKNLWSTQYQQFVQTPDASNFNPQGYAYKITKALCFLTDSGLPTNFNFYSLVKNFISFAVVRPESRSQAFAKTIYPKGVEIYPSYFDEDPIMEYKRASVLVHEARHLQMRSLNLQNNTHVVCHNSGELKGLQNCDQDFTPNWDTAGATSFEVLFFRKLYDDSTYNLNKKIIKIWIAYLLDNSFNYVDPVQRDYFLRN